jgi:hypothetical protein
MTYEFMTPEWIAAAKAIGEEYVGRVPPVTTSIRVNQVITEAPGGRTIEAHLDTSNGTTVIDLGHLAEPDVTVTTDYATARALFVDQNPQGAMQAFLGGKIRIEGDVAKLLALQAQSMQVDPLAAEAAERVRAITADMPSDEAPGEGSGQAPGGAAGQASGQAPGGGAPGQAPGEPGALA